jgi:hypothetical protein
LGGDAALKRRSSTVAQAFIRLSRVVTQWPAARRDKKVTLIRLHSPTWKGLAEGWGEPAAMRFREKQVPPVGRNDKALFVRK